MILKSRAMKTLDQATAVLEELKRTYEPKIASGTLTEEDRERIRRRLELATDLESRSQNQSNVSMLGDLVQGGKRFLKTGRWIMSSEEYGRELLALRKAAEVQIAALQR